MDAVIRTVEDLEACLGAPGLPVKMKIIDHLDATAAKWISAAPVAFMGFGGVTMPRVSIAGGPPGFATVRQEKILAIPRGALDGPIALEVGQGAGALFLVPGIGETLRANGRIARVDGTEIDITIEECFVHCAKALIRSNFWGGKPADAPQDAAAFLAATRFLALATMDQSGRIDISPKGDPANLLIRSDGDRAILAERPGNRLAFGYRNMIEQPNVAMLGVIPGTATVVQLSGRAHLSKDETIRGAFVVEGKTPILATVVDGMQPVLRRSTALQAAGLWNGVATPAIDPAHTMVAHLKLNKSRGLKAAALRLAANPKVLSSALEQHYKTQLY